MFTVFAGTRLGWVRARQAFFWYENGENLKTCFCIMCHIWLYVLVGAQFLPGLLDANLCKSKQKQANRTNAGFGAESFFF